MKIVHLINSLETGGAERVAVDLAKCGIEKGHDVKIVTLFDGDGIPKRSAMEQGLDVEVLSKSKLNPLALWKLRKLTKEADVVHAHLFPPLYLAGFLNVPTVFTEHSASNGRMGKSWLKYPERWAYNSFDVVIAISEGVEESLVNHLQNVGASPKVMRAANGISKRFFEIKHEGAESPNRIVMIGRLVDQKNPELALSAISLMEGVQLTIAGDGPLRQELERQANDLGIEDRVVFLGIVNDIPNLLSKSDLLLSTSRFEGLSTVAIEAQAAGLPVVGANVPGIRDVIQHDASGLLFDARSPEAISQAINTALSKEKYSRLAASAKENAMNYTIEKSFDRILEVYKEAIAIHLMK